MNPNKSFALKDKLTVLVNSCDAYEDLWMPFFKLYRKYWGDQDVRLLLNTESKSFTMDGLRIESVHCSSQSYSARMRNALAHVETDYVMVFLDDFFLRKPVDMERVSQIIEWMESDPAIAYFNSDCTDLYAEWETDKYPGFHRIPPGAEYVLNLQVAIWRVDMLKSYWKTECSPWEWEAYVNIRTFREKGRKFYCTTDRCNAICDYGYHPDGMGVFRGKWVIEDVKPLFEKEEIDVDFEKRGIYDPKEENSGRMRSNPMSWYQWLNHFIGVPGVLYYLLYRAYYKLCRFVDIEVDPDYLAFYQERVRHNFLRKMGNKQ